MGPNKTDGTIMKLPYINIKNLTLGQYNSLYDYRLVLHHTTEILILSSEGEIKQTTRDNLSKHRNYANTHYQVEDFQDFLDVYNQFKLMKML